MTARHSVDSLTDAAAAHYKREGWKTLRTFSGTTKKVAETITVKPQLIAKRDGMEHFVYAFGSIKHTTFKLSKQLIVDFELLQEASHIVMAVDQRVSQTNERELKKIGVGLLHVRTDGDPVFLVKPQLQCFRGPISDDRVPPRLRQGVKQILRRIKEEDVCVALLDLAQILENELDRACKTKRSKPRSGSTLGQLISEARSHGLLRKLVDNAAGRVNRPRIARAHPGTQSKRRRIVQNAQATVEDCLAVLFVLDGY